MTDSRIESRTVDVVRGFAMDAPQKANSGHPGTAMALAPLAYALYARVMRYDASCPEWPNRDRFVLSVGHASILQYSMLYLTGFGLTLDDITNFRQFGSPAAGHPERGHTPGIEVTTGPLGQGLANAVGLALAEHALRAQFGPQLFDHHTYVLCGDGDLQEGISHEAASLAGHLGLDKLVAIYDDNHISIDGPTELALSDDAAERFRSYGWHVENVGEIGEDIDALEAAINRAKNIDGKPSLIVLRSHIGYPSPKFTDTAHAHGNPFGPEEISATKAVLGMPDESFWSPDDVLEHMQAVGVRGRAAREAWYSVHDNWTENRAELDAVLEGRGLEGWQNSLPVWEAGESVATRSAGKKVLNALAPVVPGLMGGGADLTGNCGVELDGGVAFSRLNRDGRQIHFGVREHAMGSVMNGMAAHGGLIPFGGTFFVFADYMRPPVRLAALSDLRVIYSWTHDSIGVGEDGPTHQPIEHLASLRAMPKLRVIRPADANETAQAWRIAIEKGGPTALVLSRQNLPVLEGTAGNTAVELGAYILRNTKSDPDVVLIGTGSEVSLCVATADQLATEGISARVVSMPCWELFMDQDDDYQRSILGEGIPRVSVEAGSTFGWALWADACVGIDHYGASAPGPELMELFGMTVENVIEHVRIVLN